MVVHTSSFIALRVTMEPDAAYFVKMLSMPRVACVIKMVAKYW